jgi:DNA-binding MarR family transcriptional regulator
VEFGTLQDRLGLSKSALSKHLTQLTDAGYVTQDRAVRDSRSRLWLSLTPEGARAYAAHVRALQQIVASDES